MEQENQEINVGDIFIDNEYFDLYGNYQVVEVVELSIDEMWGMKGKEYVEIIKYKKRPLGFHSTITLDSFKTKFKSIVEVRDEKLNKLLDGLL